MKGAVTETQLSLCSVVNVDYAFDGCSVGSGAFDECIRIICGIGACVECHGLVLWMGGLWQKRFDVRK